MLNSVKRFQDELSSIRRDNYRGRIKPHKPLMLLAIIALMDAVVISKNKIVFNGTLKDKFKELFLAVRQEKDWCHPSEPFFHLRSSGFWFHKPRPGRELECVSLDTSGGGNKRILENIEYGFFDPETFELLIDIATRRIIREFVLQNFFSAQENNRLFLLLK